jgi:ribonuclease III
VADDLAGLEGVLQYTFKDIKLLEQATTHSSYAQKRATHNPDYERLEFFGDAILKFIVSEHLFAKFPTIKEGALTKKRSHLIADQTLALYSSNLELSKFVQVSYSERQAAGHERPALLADIFEAIIGAIYLDGGIDSAKTFVLRTILKMEPQLEKQGWLNDYKSALQEWLQRNQSPLPEYIVEEASGPDHQKEFRIKVTCLIHGESKSFVGTGQSKKESEKNAAEAAWLFIQSSAS